MLIFFNFVWTNYKLQNVFASVKWPKKALKKHGAKNNQNSKLSSIHIKRFKEFLGVSHDIFHFGATLLSNFELVSGDSDHVMSFQRPIFACKVFSK